MPECKGAVINTLGQILYSLHLAPYSPGEEGRQRMGREYLEHIVLQFLLASAWSLEDHIQLSPVTADWGFAAPTSNRSGTENQRTVTGCQLLLLFSASGLPWVSLEESGATRELAKPLSYSSGAPIAQQRSRQWSSQNYSIFPLHAIENMVM